MMKQHFSMFALYNRWANERIYEAAAKLDDADYRADHGAFFSSVHGTLNHLLVADRIWMHRFTKEGPSPSRLDEILFENHADLMIARQDEDERIIDYIEELTEDAFGDPFSYRTIVKPVDIVQPLSPALAHFFNHQTHHRGQAHALLTRISGRDAVPSLDLIKFQRTTGIGLA
jgi:uncharacterized damage-inducible protein DinB